MSSGDFPVNSLLSEISLFQDSYAQNNFSKKKEEQQFDYFLEEELLKILANFNYSSLSWFEANNPTPPTTDYYDVFSAVGKTEKDYNHLNPKYQEPYSQSSSVKPENNANAEKNLANASPNKKVDNPMLSDLIQRTANIINSSAQINKFSISNANGIKGKINLQALVDEIIENIEIAKTNGKLELKLLLKPENLGEILVKIQQDQGKINVTLWANGEALKELQNHLSELEKALSQNQISLGNLSVFSGNSGGQSENSPAPEEILFSFASEEKNPSSYDFFASESMLNWWRKSKVFSRA